MLSPLRKDISIPISCYCIPFEVMCVCVCVCVCVSEVYYSCYGRQVTNAVKFSSKKNSAEKRPSTTLS